MKLQNVITFRLSILKAAILAVWAVCFYFAVINEINDKTDERLAGYAEAVITDYLAGLPVPGEGTLGTRRYVMHAVTEGYATSVDRIRYKDTEMLFDESGRYEPARTVSYVFRTDDGQWRELVAFTTTIDKDDLKRAILYWLVALYVVAASRPHRCQPAHRAPLHEAAEGSFRLVRRLHDRARRPVARDKYARHRVPQT